MTMTANFPKAMQGGNKMKKTKSAAQVMKADKKADKMMTPKQMQADIRADKKLLAQKLKKSKKGGKK